MPEKKLASGLDKSGTLESRSSRFEIKFSEIENEILSSNGIHFFQNHDKILVCIKKNPPTSRRSLGSMDAYRFEGFVARLWCCTGRGKTLLAWQWCTGEGVNRFHGRRLLAPAATAYRNDPQRRNLPVHPTPMHQQRKDYWEEGGGYFEARREKSARKSNARDPKTWFFLDW